MWLSTIRNSLPARPPQTKASKRRRKTRRSPLPQDRLRLEQLEDRNLLSFSPVAIYGLGSSPQAVAVGDFNGDGHADVATANAYTNVSVLLNNGDGTFQAAQNYAVGNYPHSLAVGDFNADGKLDIVTANSADLSVLLGNGDGSFQSAQSLVLPGQFPPGYTGSTPLAQNPRSVAVGDLNADGKLDLAVTGQTNFTELTYTGYYGNYYTTFYNGHINVLLGHGDGTFADANTYLNNDSNPQAVAVADLNGDGKLDVVTNNYYGASSLLGNGDGTLQPAVSASTGGYGFSSVALGDLDRDGKLDLVLSSGYGLNVQKGQGDGTFQPGTTAALGAYAYSVAVGDINADGKLDLTAVTNRFTCTSIGYDYYGNPYCNGGVYTGEARVLLGYGDGTFAAPDTSDISNAYSGKAALADFNGDGSLDLGAANSDSTVSVGFNAANFVLPPPTLSISDVTVTEGNSGTVNAVFTVTLSAVWDQTITVHYATADNTATTADNDYQGASGTLTFLSGATSQTVTVAVNGDRLGESDETFFVNLDNATIAPIADAQGVGTILDDEPDISITDVSGAEGNAGTTNFVFTVSLSASYDQTVTVHYSTADGTATAGSDYTAKSGTLTFLAGETSQTVAVVVNGDRLGELDENFFVNLDNASSNAGLTDAQGVGTIFDDEPRLTISDASRNEGNSGTNGFNFFVSLSASYDQPVSVNYSTADGTATLVDKDYQFKAGRLIFSPGQTFKKVTVSVKGDRKFESDETFFVNLSGASSNAFVGDSQGIGTIYNDDRAPTPTRGRAISALPEGLAAARRLLDSSPPAMMVASQSASAPAKSLSAASVDRFFAAAATEKPAGLSVKAKAKPRDRATAPWQDVVGSPGLSWDGGRSF